MSVPAEQRTEGRLHALMEANELAIYTIKICCNKNVFKPEYQNALTDDIIRTAKDIYINAWAANNIRVSGSQERASERHRLQDRAITDCDLLLAQINIAYKLFHLTAKRVKYWSGLVVNAQKLLRAWRDNDSKRYR